MEQKGKLVMRVDHSYLLFYYLSITFWKT